MIQPSRVVATLCFATACGSNADVHCGPGTYLAGHECLPGDAGPDGGTRPGDWTSMRGNPVTTTPVATVTGALFGVTDDRVLVAGGATCGANALSVAVCDYRWLDDTGASRGTLAAQTTFATAPASNDGRYLALVDGGALSMCGPAAQLSGSARLVDTETAATLWTGSAGDLPALQTTEAFAHSGRWFYAPTPMAGGIPCPAAAVNGYSLAAPIGTPAAVGGLHGELADGRWFAPTTTDGVTTIAIVDPANATPAVTVATGAYFGPYLLYARNGWLHVQSFADSTGIAGQITSFDLTGASGAATTIASGDGQYPGPVGGRWATLCRGLSSDPTLTCVVHDASGKIADATITMATDVSPTLAGVGNLLVYRAAGATTLTARDLVTGIDHATTITATRTAIVVLANETTILATTGSAGLWAITATGSTELAVGVDSTWMLPAGGAFSAPAGSRSGAEDSVLIIRDGNAGTSLDVWDARTGMLVTLTDHLAYAANPGAAACTKPAPVYSVGPGAEAGVQTTRTMFFAELSATDPTQATVFVLPLDLSAPPRAVDHGPIADCRVPLVSASGKRVAVWQHHADTAGDAIAVGTF